MKNHPQIVDVKGNPIRMAIDRPHDAASRINSEVASWHPAYYSADAELLNDRPALLARTQDMIRNNGITSGAVQTHLDWVIGSGLQLNAKPNWHLLGVKDKDAMAEWERTTEAEFCSYAEDPGCYIDAARGMRFSEILAQAYRSYLISGDIVQTSEWKTGRGTYNTAIQSIDPARLCNPMGQGNTTVLRDGVQYDNSGVPIGGWVCNRVPNDPIALNNYTMDQWQFVPRETPWGRSVLMHIYDRERAGQSRGKNTGIIAALTKSKMHERMGQAALQATILNSMYAAVIESDLDETSIAAALGAGVGAKGAQPNPRLDYLEDAASFHDGHTIQYGGVRIPHLYTGEKLNMLNPNYPGAAYDVFERSVLRNCAAGWNLPYEQLSRDYSQTNYTGFRAAMLTAWQFFSGRQHFIGGRLASMIYALWLEEAMVSGKIKALPGTPDFNDAKAAWTQCEWIGPGRGTLDPLREAEATQVEMNMGLTTFERECSARGLRWEEVLEQRAQEMARRAKIEFEYGLQPGALAPVETLKPATDSTQQEAPAADGTPVGHPDHPGNPANQPVPAPAKKGT